MSVGRLYPPEWRWITDAQSGRPVHQLTAVGHNYHLYFYNPTVTPDGRCLVFYSERTGLANLFRLDLASGEIAQLTDAAPARADYWPFTPPVRGVAVCLAALGDGGRRVYYFEDNALRSVHLETFEHRHLLTVPADRRPSMLHANAAGDTLAFSTWDEALFAERAARAYPGEPFPEDAFFQQTTSTITRVDVATGAAEEVLRLPNFWINHVILHPTRRNLILFCHEFTPDPDRMWLLDTNTNRCAPIPGQAADEWYQHEFWSADESPGEARICFHGGWHADPTRAFAGWCRADGSGYARFTHTTPGRAYAHYNLHPAGRAFVTDGEAHPGCLSRVELVDGQQRFTVLCRHDSSEPVEDQRAHPHPSFTPDGRHVLFTANHVGLSNIYAVTWDAPADA
jgi:oligogalacturonide lyase